MAGMELFKRGRSLGKYIMLRIPAGARVRFSSSARALTVRFAWTAENSPLSNAIRHVPNFVVGKKMEKFGADVKSGRPLRRFHL